MSDEPRARSSRFGGIFVAAVVLGSFVGVIGWYVATNRTGPAIDGQGFDLSTAPQSPRAAQALSAAPAPQQAVSSLGMLKGDKGVRILDSGGGSGGADNAAPAAAAKGGDKKDQSHASFTEMAHKHEADVRRFSEMMTKKYPVIRQYGKDWMSHPDLRNLTDNYMRNHDPVAFMMGLAKAPSVGTMVKQYAGSPEIRQFIVEGMKEAPAELTSSAMDVLASDGVVKNLVANVAQGLGLPPSVTGLIASGGDPSKLDQKQVVNDMMKNNPDMQNALQQQGQQAPPVALPNQR